MLTASLQPHPSTPCAIVQSITAQVSRADPGSLCFTYAIFGSIDSLCIPERRDGQRADRLWQHTCFEAFIRAPGSAHYLELNFSPSGDWAAYQFTGYREGMSHHTGIAPARIGVRREAHEFTLEAEVRIANAIDHVQLALCAVLEDRRGGTSYWALHHASGKADFHHAAGFTLMLPAADATETNP